MKYVQVAASDIAIGHVVNTLSSRLRSRENVAWFLSGGSAIDLEVRAAQALQEQDTSRLCVGLVDERYGPPGHEDENYSQLMQAGFPLPITRVLTGDPIDQTAAAFSSQLEQLFRSAHFLFGVFGIGADGHTAGIKPHSPSVAGTGNAVGYAWDDYERITMTPAAIRRLDEAIIYAVGSEKAETLRSLFNTSAPLDDQPAQVLKDIKTSTLYTDTTL